MEVKVDVSPKSVSNPTVYSGAEVYDNPGVYRHRSYDDQFLISTGNLLIYVPYQKPQAWMAGRDDCHQWIPTDQTITITFKGDN